MEKKKLILVTNDDGIHARGLDALIEVVRPYGEVFVIAPEEGQSGMAHAITVKYPIRVRKVHEENGLVKYRADAFMREELVSSKQ